MKLWAKRAKSGEKPALPGPRAAVMTDENNLSLETRSNPAKQGRPSQASHHFVTAADAKIPLSVGQVKQEPQYVVFCSPCVAPLSATAAIACAKRCNPRLWRNSGATGGRIGSQIVPRPISPQHQFRAYAPWVSLTRARGRVFLWISVRVVEKRVRDHTIAAKKSHCGNCGWSRCRSPVVPGL